MFSTTHVSKTKEDGSTFGEVLDIKEGVVDYFSKSFHADVWRNDGSHNT